MDPPFHIGTLMQIGYQLWIFSPRPTTTKGVPRRIHRFGIVSIERGLPFALEVVHGIKSGPDGTNG
jgi:hypothetical protein